MKQYEKVIIKIDERLRYIIFHEEPKKLLVINLFDVVGLSFNKPKPYLGDYYETEDKDGI